MPAKNDHYKILAQCPLAENLKTCHFILRLATFLSSYLYDLEISTHLLHLSQARLALDVDEVGLATSEVSIVAAQSVLRLQCGLRGNSLAWHYHQYMAR